jgi:DNA-binding HxlR family transcriptional regulator
MARAMGEIGDGWILLTLWHTLNGSTRFEMLQDKLGVARNILSDRLRRLVDDGLLERQPISPESRRFEYVPTQKAQELRQALILMQEWGQTHCPLSAKKAA